MELLERERAHDALQEGVARAADGEGVVALVAGEAGVGKTVLVRAFTESLGASTDALWGVCDPLRTPRPLGPLRDVAEALGPALLDALRDAAPAHEIFALAHERLRTRPRLLVIEDLHWADEATLDFVRYVGRRIADLPVLLVLTYRDEIDAAHPLRAVLGDLVRSDRTTRIELRPLSAQAVTRLIGDQGLDAVAVHRTTGGNPFFVSQILAQPDSPLPPSVRDAVVARTAVLTAEHRRGLQLLSCAPEAVSPRLLEALGVPFEAVEALAATGLLDRHPRGVTFRHEIGRLAVLDAVPPGLEPILHIRMLTALEAIDGDPSVLAHHAVAAGDVARILMYAPQAAAVAARTGAHREAVAFYRTALAHADGCTDAQRADLLEPLAIELYFVNELGEAIAALTKAMGLRHAAGDIAAVGTAHWFISRFEWFAANRAVAERHGQTAIDTLHGSTDARALGFAYCNRAYLAMQRADVATALELGALGKQVAARLDDVELATTASISMAAARLLEGDISARGDLTAAAEAGLRHKIDELATLPMSNLAYLDVEQGRFADAEVVLADSLRFTEEHDIVICNLWQRGVLCRLRMLQGRWDDAEREARQVIDERGPAVGQVWPNLVLGLLTTRRAASPNNPYLDEGWRLAVRFDEPHRLAPAAAALAEQAWITGRPDPRLDRMCRQLGGLEFAGRQRALAPLRLWLRRLREAGVPHVDLDGVPAREPVVGGADGGEQGPPHLPYEEALARVDAGAPADLLAALDVLDGLGATAVAALVRRRLRAMGVSGIPRGRRPATRANPAGLTDRQLEVLQLLVDGLSNADIAQRLYISPKTADHHVSAILGKLGVRSRGAAAAAARALQSPGVFRRDHLGGPRSTLRED